MNDKNNKTSICSIVFLDIIDYSKKTDSEQIEIKNQFNDLINYALKDVAENDRIILDTGDGAAIASNGSPEDVLFTSLNIRDEIIKNNIHSATPLYVRFGINLGPVRVVQDINGRPNIIGDGINVAQRIMSFAKPNQILVSRSYYEVTSRLTQEISQMFDYSGVKQDKHVREHEIYSVRLLKEQTELVDQALEDTRDRLLAPKKVASKNINWKYVALTAPALLAFFLIVKAVSEPSTPTITVADSPASPQIVPEVGNDGLLPNESIENVQSAASLHANDASKNGTKTELAAVEKTPEELVEIDLAKKKARQKANKKTEETNASTLVDLKAQPEPQQSIVVENKADQHKEAMAKRPELKADTEQEKSGWTAFKESVKQGGEVQCSPAQIAMNQCN